MRTRIVATIAVLNLITMGVAGFLVYALEHAEIDHNIDQQIDQEIAEFRRLQEGRDPATGQDFTSAETLLRLYLERNVTDDDEMLVAYTGAGRLISPNSYGQGILDEPTYLDAVAGLEEQASTDGGGGTVRIDSPRYHEVWVTLVPITNLSDAADSGSLVIVNFVDDERSELYRTMRTYAIVALVALALIALLATWRAGQLLAPLTTLRDTARALTATDLSRRIPVRGNDDITALTVTINEMLDRLESGFADQRKFLDDAGHELKTPLTVLRGHLELLDSADPAEVEEAKAILLDEVDRMSRLVGDLMMLAKARRPDFVTPDEVDLERLTTITLAKARGLGERDWQLDEVAEGPGRLVVADEQRLTQSLLQLADNAVKHTDPGDVVAFGSRRAPGAFQLWVRDTGDGIPEADRLRIFERFGRSVVRPGDEGFGLGLSIVKAVVDAHGGSVEVQSPPGGGALFQITIPTEEDPSWPAS